MSVVDSTAPAVRTADPKPASVGLRARAVQFAGSRTKLLQSMRRRARYTAKAAKRRELNPETARYAEFCNTKAIQDDLVCYESYYGAGMICNPYAIFRRLVDDPRYAHLRHVWIIDEQEERDFLEQEFSASSNVSFVLRSSDEYYLALATAKFLVQNVTFPAFFAKRPGQVYVNTWHSITVKTLGYDQPNGNVETRNMIRNLLMSDYICSPNRFMTGIFRGSFKLQGLYPGKMIETGHARNDVTAAASRQEVLRKLRRRGIEVDPDKKIVLYAPTWRGATVGTVVSPAEEFEEFRRRLGARIDLDEYQLLLKPHHLSYRAMTDEERAAASYIPRTVDTNELLGAVDILISDYSSIYFDFMVTDRPVLFYLTDHDAYEKERGVYFAPEDLPGPVTDSVEQLGDWITRIDEIGAESAEKYAETKAWACEFDDGQASGRIVDIIFDQQPSDRVLTDFVDPERKRILFYVSELGANGVTSAFLTLLRHLADEPYDITVAGLLGKSAESKQNWRLIGTGDYPGRVILHFGGMTLAKDEVRGIEYVRRYGLDGPLPRYRYKPERALRREFVRWFGDVNFDYVIDFSGYGAIWPSVFAQQEGGRKLVWQHNDLGKDLANRAKRGLARYRSNPVSVTGLKSAYEQFDQVVACGEAIMHINRERLNSPTIDPKYTFADNLIDADRVRTLVDEETLTELDGNWIVARDIRSLTGRRDMVLLPNDPPAPESGEPYVTFVTMGRLAPEKNHSALITAFAGFASRHPNSRLFIIGHGDLYGALARKINRLDLAGRVVITGNLQNPFGVIKHCDCFVLPSKYEGNVMVVPEVRILGIPVIMSDFGSVSSASIPGGQLIVGTEAAALEQGLEAFVAGEVPGDYEFDIDGKNRESLRQFTRLLRGV